MEGSARKEESFKLYFGENNEIRRVSLYSPTFSDVVKQLHDLYAKDGLYHPELRVQYMDDEGDKITVNSQCEWEEMFNNVGTTRPIKLYITEGTGIYFKDGPAPAPQYFYISNAQKDKIEDDEDDQMQTESSVEKLENTEHLNVLQTAVPDCLARLFPGGKILPHHLPDWLKDSGVITIKNVPNASRLEEVDLDIDVTLLIVVLNKQALNYIGDDKTIAELNMGKDFLLSVIDISPENSLALYNLVCAESLLGNIDAAIDTFKKVVQIRTVDEDFIAHIETDSDLDNIRGTDGFKTIMGQLKGTPQAESDGKDDMDADIDTESIQERLQVHIQEHLQQNFEEQIKEHIIETAQEMEVEVEERKIPKDFSGSKWAKQLTLLHAMGFDTDLCSFLLDEYSGNVEKVIDAFTKGSMQ
eukprot:TRINITY_DN540_c0_g1_i6.p1 TRINITY_DN540_c0_g1~~TRINITY_DN540_c0_g1_i6.p1  ORF type:complete len:430 (+),score=111.94 TRINITY_DN540_c0_g1_i6:50-1291(+)